MKHDDGQDDELQDKSLNSPKHLDLQKSVGEIDDKLSKKSQDDNQEDGVAVTLNPEDK